MTDSLCTSLCIPRLKSDTSKSSIINRFNELGIGKVEKVDLICKSSEKGEKFYSAFIHICWNNSDLSKYIIERVNSGKDVKIIYDNFLFWKVFINKSLKGREKPNGREKSNGIAFNKEHRISQEMDSNIWERNAKIM
jgi:hypothetical protein